MVASETTFIDFLRSQGVLTQEQAERIRREAESRGLPSLEIMEQEGGAIATADLLRLASEFYSVPLWEFPRGEPAVLPEVLALIPEEAARAYHMLPLEKSGSLLKVGIRAPEDVKLTSALRFLSERSGLLIQPYLISRKELEAGLALYGRKGESRPAAATASGVAIKTPSRAPAPKPPSLATFSFEEEGAIIKVVEVILRQAVEGRASDIHIEPETSRVRVRFRVDGVLYHSLTLPLEALSGIVSRIKILSALRIDEIRRPQDGRFRLQVAGREVDFRVATFPTTFGEKMVVRVLDPLTGLRSLGELGVEGSSRKKFETAVKKPFGMICMSGPTGSGKTTTQYAILQSLDQASLNIVTLEDPVEYSIPGIYQSQVRPEIGYDFAIGLRHILRQDPDVIMVGEIRDRETAGLAVHAALTGHIVLSTLHTNNALGVIPRLLDLGVEPFLIPPAVNLMSSQRLVRKLCPSCKRPRPVSTPEERVVRKALAELPQEEQARASAGELRVFDPVGCAACAHKGTKGRVGLFEVFLMTPRLSQILAQSISEAKLEEEAKAQQMVSLLQDGILKALGGVVSLQEVFEVVGETQA